MTMWIPDWVSVVKYLKSISDKSSFLTKGQWMHPRLHLFVILNPHIKGFLNLTDILDITAYLKRYET